MSGEARKVSCIVQSSSEDRGPHSHHIISADSQLQAQWDVIGGVAWARRPERSVHGTDDFPSPRIALRPVGVQYPRYFNLESGDYRLTPEKFDPKGSNLQTSASR